jgi:hypothetical protein
MLISEYFESAVKQRSAAFRTYSYLTDKGVDYHIFYNVNSLNVKIRVENLEEKLSLDNELPKIFDSIMLKKYYRPGFFKDNKYILVKLEGKLQKYKDVREDTIFNNISNNAFIDESVALTIQEKYLKSLSNHILNEFGKIQNDDKLVDMR